MHYADGGSRSLVFCVQPAPLFQVIIMGALLHIRHLPHVRRAHHHHAVPVQLLDLLLIAQQGGQQLPALGLGEEPPAAGLGAAEGIVDVDAGEVRVFVIIRPHEIDAARLQRGVFQREGLVAVVRVVHQQPHFLAHALGIAVHRLCHAEHILISALGAALL